MIELCDVVKDVGRGRMRKRVLNGIDWTIPTRTQFVILGQAASGKTTLLHILSGLKVATNGIVRRRGSICSPAGIGSLGPGLTARQLATRAARLYHCDPQTIIDFTSEITQLGHLINVPLPWLTAPVRQRIQFSLRYAIPFDCYVFDGAIGIKGADTLKIYRELYDLRSREASMIVATRQPAFARTFDAYGGVLYQGRLSIFKTVEEAVLMYEGLPKVETNNQTVFQTEIPDDESDNAMWDMLA